MGKISSPRTNVYFPITEKTITVHNEGKNTDGGEGMGIFIKHSLQENGQSCFLKDCHVLLLDIIQEHVEELERQHKEDIKSAEICMDLFEKYCIHKNEKLELWEVDEELLWQFFLVWVPKEANKLPDSVVYGFLHIFDQFCNGISARYEYNITQIYAPVYADLLEELPRILQVKKQFSRYLGNPIVCWDPMIIDLECYKQYRIKSSTKEAKEIFEQGYFEVMEITPSNAVILKKRQGYGLYAKVILDDTVIQHLRNRDILYVRMKRKLFFTCWDIEEVKSCYLPKAQKYIK